MKINANELLKIAQKEKPHIDYRLNRQCNALAAFDKKLSRFVVVAGLGIDNEWYSMEHEILINGKPCFKQEDFSCV